MKNRTTYEELSQDVQSTKLGNQIIQNSISTSVSTPENTKNTQVTRRKIDRQTKSLLSYLFTGTRGGNNRIKIMLHLAERPLNINQLSNELGLDYKAIKFHIEILEKNNVVAHAGEKYGVVYFLSTFLEYNIDTFNEIVAEFRRHSKLI
ncbi:MAG: ArsR/SmtB family transcription factor [Nitrosotalea sp.]